MVSFHIHGQGIIIPIYPPSDFKSKCHGKLENLGNNAMNAKEYDEAISQYTIALSLNPASPQQLLIKRSKSCAGKGLWKDALNDANEVAHFQSPCSHAC